MPPEYRARIEEGRPRLLAMAKQQYGLDLQQGPFGIDSRPALIGAKFAEAQGHGPAYHDRVLRGYWQQAIDIGDTAQLTELATAAGLDRNQFAAALHDAQYDQQVQADIEQAANYGLQGVPALVFDNRYLVSGAQPLNVLQRVVDQILQEAANETDAAAAS